MIFVTGGAGFIGANFILNWLQHHNEPVLNIDKLTYAGNLQSLADVEQHENYHFVCADINDKEVLEQLFAKHRPRAILHFAAESHVDRSISGPQAFVETNVNGTFTLLEVAKAYWLNLPAEKQKEFRFLHVSTDEVYGSLSLTDPAFSETTPYAPNSPYSASKAASDHLVRAYHHTYGLPTLTTNCSNNYGSFQFPEKLIPLIILNALNNKPLPIYGDGQNIRDWLYVIDHCDAIATVLAKGVPGETYNIGGNNERTNLEVVHHVCEILDELKPTTISYKELITYVKDRPGHDRRYAIDAQKIKRELGWEPKETFATGIRKTVEWYLNHQDWVNGVISGEYKDWVNHQYSEKVKL